MSLKPQLVGPIPAEIAAWGTKHLAIDSPYHLVGDTLLAQFHDTDFSDLYHPEGKPGLSPVLLSFVLIFQHLEKLPDRATAEAFTTRLDWKYALHRPLDDPGFDPSVLTDFRQRLLDHAAEQRCFQAILTYFQSLGLLKTRGRQRTDSTHVLGAIRALNRLETAGETLRYALNVLADAVPEWLRAQVAPAWLERYGVPFQEWHLPQREAERKALIAQIGQDGLHLLQAIDAPSAPAGVCDLPAVQILRRVWLQQFYQDADGIRWRTPDELPPAATAINTPFDAEARYSKKRSTIWVGYKVHLTESCDDAAPRLITNVEVTPAPTGDTEVTDQIHDHLAEAGHLPSVHLTDAGYVDAEHLVRSQREHQVDLFGPVPVNPGWQARAGSGFGSADFRVDWERLVATCPQGKQSRMGRSYPDSHGTPMLMFAFQAADCRACAVWKDCTRSESPYRGRVVGMRLREAHEALSVARARQQTQAFRAEYAMRAGIEGSLSQGVRRCNLRQSRYLGLAKTRLQELFIATALNLARVSAFCAGDTFRIRAAPPFVQLMAASA